METILRKVKRKTQRLLLTSLRVEAGAASVFLDDMVLVVDTSLGWQQNDWFCNKMSGDFVKLLPLSTTTTTYDKKVRGNSK